MMNLRAACLLFILLALSAGSAMGQETKPNGSPVRVVVTVADSAGRPVSGLTQEQFTVVEKKNPLEIVSFDAQQQQGERVRSYWFKGVAGGFLRVRL
jgi:hypothetical protein